MSSNSNTKNTQTNPQTNKPAGALQGVSHVGPTWDKYYNKSNNIIAPASDRLDFRVNKLIKEKYRSLSSGKKKIVKLMLQTIILALADDKEHLQEIAKELGVEMVKQNINPILNINVNVNEPKAINNVNIDISKLLDVANELERLMITIKEYNWDPKKNAYIIPKARMDDLSELINKIRKLMN